MAKQKRPNGTGSYRKLKDGRIAWRQMIDGQTRELSAKTPKELQEKIKTIADNLMPSAIQWGFRNVPYGVPFFVWCNNFNSYLNILDAH